VRTPDATVYVAGDTGYFSGFAEIGRRFRPDVALLPIAGYEPASFREEHMSPLDAVYAFEDLGARVLIPTSYGSFPLSYEPLGAPLEWLHEIMPRGLPLCGAQAQAPVRRPAWRSRITAKPSASASRGRARRPLTAESGRAKLRPFQSTARSGGHDDERNWRAGGYRGVLAGCGAGRQQTVTESDFCSQKAEAECQVSDDCLADAAACVSQRVGICMTFGSAAKSSGKRSSLTTSFASTGRRTIREDLHLADGAL
jgi:hypothetical protein